MLPTVVEVGLKHVLRSTDDTGMTSTDWARVVDRIMMLMIVLDIGVVYGGREGKKSEQW